MARPDVQIIESAAVSEASSYVAFISYRHTDNTDEDRQWGTWLHQQLEIYDIPAELIGTRNSRGKIIPERLYPVFRDEVSLPADADLTSAIREALDQSQYLIVLCSPRAVQSTYVSREIEHFKASGKAGRVMAALLLGEPNASIDAAKVEDPEDARTLECFPRPLQYEVSSSGKLLLDSPTQPLAADFRLPDGSKGITNPNVYRRQLLQSGEPRARAEQLATAYEEKINTARLKIIAGILGVPLESLTQRDKANQLKKARAQTRRAWRVGVAMTALFGAAMLAAVIAHTQYQNADEERRRAESLLVQVRDNLDFINHDLQEVLRAYVPIRTRERVMKQVDEIVASLEEHSPDSAADIRRSAVSNLHKADLILRASSQDPAQASSLLEKSLVEFQRLVELDPGNAQFQRYVTVTHLMLGEIGRRRGATDAALAHYNQALEIALKLVGLDPSNTKFQRNVVASYLGIGNIRLRLGQTEAALLNYNQALEVASKLVELDPRNTYVQHDVGASYVKLGDIRLRLGETDAALSNYNRALEVALMLANLDPGNVVYQREVAVTYAKLGDIKLRLGRTDGALSNYKQALAIRLKLVELDPADIVFQRDVSVSYERLGNIQLRVGETESALASYNQALGAALKLVKVDPANTQFQRTLWVSYDNLGDIQRRLGEADAALSNYNKALEIALKFAELDPGNAQFQRDVFVSNRKLGDLYEEQLDSIKSRAHLLRAHEKIVWMKEKGILTSDDYKWIENLEKRLDHLQVQ